MKKDEGIKKVPMRDFGLEIKIDDALVDNERLKVEFEAAHPPANDRMSGSGKCVRDRWARLNGIPVELDRVPGPRALKLMKLGNLYEGFVLQLLADAGFTVHSQQLEVGVKPFVGHIDGIIEREDFGGPVSSLLEIKSTGTAQMDKLYDVGYVAWNPSYGAQLQSYMHALGLDDAVAVVIARDDANIYAERILYDLDAALELVENSTMATGKEMPDRPAAARGPSSKFCHWCSRVTWCYSPALGWEV